MKRTRLLVLLLWPLLDVPLPALAQSPELIGAFEQYKSLNALGKYAEAEPFARKALQLGKIEFGPDHKQYATLLNNLAEVYRAQSRYGEAEPLYKRSLTILEKAPDLDHSSVAILLNNLAELYRDQGRYGEAEPLYKRSLKIKEKVLGPDHSGVANSLNNLAELYRDQGRYGEAEPLHKRALAIREEALGPDHQDVAVSLNNLALLYHAQGHYGEAEVLHKRSLAIREALGLDHPDVARSLNNLAVLYESLGRYDEAKRLFKRALASWEKALGPGHLEVANSLNNLAALYGSRGRYGEAEPLHERSLAIREKAHGPDHPEVANSLNNLAALYRVQGRFGEAEPLHKRALAIREEALGSDHPDVATSLANLAAVYTGQERYGEAGPLCSRSQAIVEKVLGPDHPIVASSLSNLAGLYRAQGHHELALEHIRRASAIHRGRAARAGGGRSAGGLSEQRSVRAVFLRHLQAAIENPGDDVTARAALTAEAFEAGQLANATGVGTAVAGMAARFAVGDDALAALVRKRQDATERWRQLDGMLVKAASRPPARRDQASEAAMRGELAALDQRIEGIDARLETQFPEFAELSSPQPVSLAEAQALLGEDEALLTYLVWEDRSFVFALRHDRVVDGQIDIGKEELGEAVSMLREGLDPTGVLSLEDLPLFDTSSAFELYQKLFQPVEHVLAGAGHVFVVPDGALQSLPLGVLVTKESTGEITDFSGYRETAWLARKYAITTLPSVSSLRALRTFARRAGASRPFLGVGDPQLKGKTGSNRGVELAPLYTARGTANVESVRGLASLPDSAGELESLARTLGAGDEALLLGTEATERRVKRAPLADYRVLAFATHGLVRGDLRGLAEPALVLTPPAEGTAEDDGLLTASEVAQLELDADWVILSACNTAAADGTPGAEGLSGLAKAFFYAGSRALLVSHWPVESEAAVRLTTRMLAEAAKPGVARAEAHRRAMMTLIADEDRPFYAHPLYWAPFVVVGEGGAEP